MTAGTRPRNRILASLPRDEYERIAGHLEPVRLEPRDVLQEANEPVSRVYFPNSGVVSLLTVMRDGTCLESVVVGSEGAVALNPLLGTRVSPWRWIVQSPGEAEAMPLDAFRRQIGQNPRFLEQLVRYTGVMLAMAMQSAACNRFHSREARCARWLLQMGDRTEADRFPMTHEFLSAMLGVHRPSTTVALGTLVEAGLIERSQRGVVRIADRAGLRQAACECYDTLRRETALLLGAEGE